MKHNKNLMKLLNLHYLKYANKTASCGEFDMPALYCNIDTYPDYIALYSNVKDYHKTERTAISFFNLTTYLMEKMDYFGLSILMIKYD